VKGDLFIIALMIDDLLGDYSRLGVGQTGVQEAHVHLRGSRQGGLSGEFDLTFYYWFAHDSQPISTIRLARARLLRKASGRKSPLLVDHATLNNMALSR
jgi:hypothetical protein